LFSPLTANGFYLLREGANHTIYTNGPKTIPVKRHKTLDRLTANEI
jgi:mRNA interferase HicA